jgi:hypothetical protein
MGIFGRSRNTPDGPEKGMHPYKSKGIDLFKNNPGITPGAISEGPEFLK